MPHRLRAFSLVELLVVLAVIVVLAGLLMPVLGQVRHQARSVQCQGNLRQLGLACMAYVQDNRSLPWGIDQASAWTTWSMQIRSLLLDRPSGPDQGFFLCPEATLPPLSNWQMSVMHCHYSVMPNVFETRTTPPAVTFPARASELRPDLALIFDGTQDSGYNDSARELAYNAPGAFGFLGDADDDRILTESGVLPDGIGYGISYRHPGQRVNVVFVDGHTASCVRNRDLTYGQMQVACDGRNWNF